LIELFHAEMQVERVKFVPSPMAVRAFEQLMNLETEMRESGIVYSCPAGQHDDLGISCAMLAWAAGHPHLNEWFRIAYRDRMRPKPRPQAGWAAFV
jgi:hypothetical protein